jgi:hypothetical protein
MKLFIAIPCHDGKPLAECSQSIVENATRLITLGYEVCVYYHSRNIYLDQARNYCVHKFLNSDCTDLIFIDSDVSFKPDSIEKLLKHDKDIIGGIYPLKQDELQFPTEIKFNEENNCKEESTGLVYSTMVPTGFLRIKRNVFDRLIESDTERKKYRIQKDQNDVYTFFNTGILFDDNKWRGEDVAFCKYWLEIGGELFIEPDITFNHTGTKHWEGNFYNYLMSRRVDLIDKAEGIKGWTSEKELAALREFASLSDSVVEIGSWKGRSTKELLENCRGTVYAVDTWEGSIGDISGMIAKEQNIYSEFMKNVGDYPNLKVLKGNSIDIGKDFKDKVDMVFIDANHDYESVKADIETWLPKCKKILCGHDYSLAFPGVIKAVNEKFDVKYKADTLWWVEL